MSRSFARAKMRTRPVSNVQNVNATGSVIDGKEEAVGADYKMAHFVSEGATLGSERTTFRPAAQTLRFS
jgi:hypothetical protein